MGGTVKQLRNYTCSILSNIHSCNDQKKIESSFQCTVLKYCIHQITFSAFRCILYIFLHLPKITCTFLIQKLESQQQHKRLRNLIHRSDNRLFLKITGFKLPSRRTLFQDSRAKRMKILLFPTQTLSRHQTELPLCLSNLR